MEQSPPNCKYETFTIHTSSIGASSNTSFTSTFTRPIKDVVEASIISASIRRPDFIHLSITNTLVTGVSSATITHDPLSRPLTAGDAVTVSGHTGTNADLILNAGYTVTSTPTLPTQTLLTADAAGTLPLPMVLPTSQSVAASATSTTITFTTGARTLYAGETVIISGHTGTPQDLAMNGTFTVDADSAGTTAILTKTSTGAMTPGTYNTGTISTTTQPTSGIYNTGTVVASTDAAVAATSNVVYIRVEELETDFDDFIAAGQPAVATSSAPFNFTTGSGMLRRCFGAIYSIDNIGSSRFSYKDRYHMVSQYIDSLKRLDRLSITLYDANGVQLDTAQSDGITYLTFEFKCMRKNLCNFNICN
jgi:hypothetical protein